jgi:hypothetical protein
VETHYVRGWFSVSVAVGMGSAGVNSPRQIDYTTDLTGNGETRPKNVEVYYYKKVK